MRHTCFKARCDVQVVICLDGHPLLHTTAHYSSVIMARLISFIYFFVMTCSFHSSPTERSWLGFLSCSSSLSSFSWAVTGVRPSRSSYCPKMNWDCLSLHEPSSSVPPPEPDVFHCFGNGSPHSALLHTLIHVYFVPITPCFALKCTEIHFQYFLLPFAQTWSPAQTFLFCSIFSTFPPLFSPRPSCPAPSILLHTGGESAVPTEQHWCGGQRHVPALRQPSYCISLWGRHLGQEAPAQDRKGSQTHVQGKAG